MIPISYGVYENNCYWQSLLLVIVDMAMVAMTMFAIGNGPYWRWLLWQCLLLTLVAINNGFYHQSVQIKYFIKNDIIPDDLFNYS